MNVPENKKLRYVYQSVGVEATRGDITSISFPFRG